MKFLNYLKENIDIKAFNTGKAARLAGKDCAPILDKDFFDSLPKDDKRRTLLMKSWTRGWIQTNFNCKDESDMSSIKQICPKCGYHGVMDKNRGPSWAPQIYLCPKCSADFILQSK
jgi:hypothetical protein